jgi:hypothetical protein
MADTPPKGTFRRIILPLLEKVLVPIVCAGVGALGVYYAEIAKLAKDAGREAAGEEIKRADDAREFVFANLPAVAPVVSATEPFATPAEADEAKLERLLELWHEKHPESVRPVALDLSGEIQEQDTNQAQWQAPPADYMKRALREAQQVQAQVQEQR